MAFRVSKMKVKQVMIAEPRTLRPQQTLEEAAKIYLNSDVNCAPVVNEDGNVLGILTLVGLLAALMKGYPPHTPAAEVMEQSVPIICEDENFEDVVCDHAVERLVVTDSEGNLTGILNRINLIKRVYETLETTRNKLEVVLDSIYNGIIAIDLEERIILFNPAAERITGVKVRQALGNPISSVIPDLALPKILVDPLSQPTRMIELNNISLICTSSPIYHHGNVIGAVSVLQDVSELNAVTNELSRVKELNDELESIIESSSDGILVASPNKEILRFNTSSMFILNLPASDTISDIAQLPAKHCHYLSIVLDKALTGRQKASITYNTEGRDIAITANPQKDHKGNVHRVILNIRDMTELNQMKLEVEKTRDETVRYSAELQELRAKQIDITNLIARSTEMKKVVSLALRAGQHDVTVLISGESGVGKEIVAKLIQKVSTRARQPFVQINCGAIPDNLVESELFGYEPGAFTGAGKQGKPGLLETANHGTVFLDEIGEIPLILQVKLLRAIQEQVVYRVGGTKPVELDIRIIAATNKDLKEMVRQKLFREDLFYRLNVIHIHIPPLRERKEDIVPLANHFLQRFNAKYGCGWRMSPEVYTMFELYQWPGNIREMENYIERAVIMSDDEVISSRHISSSISIGNTEDYRLRLDGIMPLRQATEILERELVGRALASYQSTRKAAKVLGVTHTTVQRKIRQYGLTEPPDVI